MKKPSAKKNARKKTSPASKAKKGASKVLRKIVKKIRKIAKKTIAKKTIAKKLTLPRRAPKKPKPDVRKLVLKESFVKIVQEGPVPAAPASSSESAPKLELPPHYSENKLTLLVRDPWWLFAYWEVTPWREAEVTADIARAGLSRQKTVLRVYDITGSSLDKPSSHFDIEIQHLNSNWYVDVGAPDREWIAEIGYKTHDGRFFMLVRSNSVKTPAFGISDVLDEEWMMPDELYFKLLGIMGGFDADGGGGSHNMRKMVERYVRQVGSSEGSAQFSKPRPNAPNV